MLMVSAAFKCHFTFFLHHSRNSGNEFVITVRQLLLGIPFSLSSVLVRAIIAVSCFLCVVAFLFFSSSTGVFIVLCCICFSLDPEKRRDKFNKIFQVISRDFCFSPWTTTTKAADSTVGRIAIQSQNKTSMKATK